MSPDLLERLFVPRLRRPPVPVAPGLYEYTRLREGQTSRFHLRVDQAGSGLLVANATAIAMLSASGVVIAQGLLEDKTEDQILQALDEQFTGAAVDQQQADIARMRALIDELADPNPLYPVFNLEDPAVSPLVARLIPPIEADISLAEPDRLLAVVERLWNAAIPHVTIVVGEAPDPAALVPVVQRASELGLICGVSGRASDLQQGTLIEDLVQAGIDHITAYFASAEPAVHDAIFGDGDHAAAVALFQRTEALELADVAHIPLIYPTLKGFDTTLRTIRALGVPNAKFYAVATAAEEGDGAIPAQALPQVASDVEDEADAAEVRYQWEPPVLRDLTVSLDEQVRQGPRCSSDLAVRVEPDGSVIPPRGPYAVAGNLLREEWPVIWQRDAFLRYRQRVESPTRCRTCPGLVICAADCPREPAGWSQPGGPGRV